MRAWPLLLLLSGCTFVTEAPPVAKTATRHPAAKSCRMAATKAPSGQDVSFRRSQSTTGHRQGQTTAGALFICAPNHRATDGSHRRAAVD